MLQNANDRAIRAKEKLDSVKRLQQFYTPEPIVRKMLDSSKLLKGYDNKLNILEPSCGIGNIVIEIFKLRKEHQIYMCEIDPKNCDINGQTSACTKFLLKNCCKYSINSSVIQFINKKKLKYIIEIFVLKWMNIHIHIVKRVISEHVYIVKWILVNTII
jgi:predicted RNA methylase